MDKIRLRREQFLQSFKDFLKRVVFDGGTLEAPVYVNKLLKSIQNASILQIPVTFGLGKLYNQIGEDFDVVRGSNVWRTNEHGYYEEVKDNRPCIDYTDGFPVLLTQPQSTNFIKNSSTLSLQEARGGSFVTDNAAISPEGIQNAAIYETDGDTNSYLKSTINFTSTSAAQLATFSYHVKYTDTQWIRFSVLTFNVGASVWFDILNGVIGTNNFPLDVTPKIEPLKDGWYRISITREFDFSTDRSGQIRLFLVSGDDTSVPAPSGNQVALYEPQAEELGYATTPIKTGANVVTRLQDEVGNAGSINTINSEEGVLLINAAAFSANDIGTNRAISLSDGSFNNSIFFQYKSQQTSIKVFYRKNNAIIAGITIPDVSILDYKEFAVTWDDTSLSLYINGVSFSEQTLIDVFSPNTLNVLSMSLVIGVPTSRFEAKTKELRVYRTQEDASKDLPYIIPFDADFLQSYKNFINDIRNIGGITEKKTYTDDLLKQAVNASLVTVPTSYGVGKLFNQSPNDRLEDFDVVRNSDVWRTNKGGILENIGINVPCIDYTDGFPVLLTQPQSTNKLIYSNDFSQSYWEIAGINKTLSTIISPSGIQDAYKISVDTSTGIHYTRASIPGITLGDMYVFSVYLKAAEYDKANIRVLNGFSTTFIEFDLINGTHNGTDEEAKIINVGNGWFRCIRFSDVSGATQASVIPYIYPSLTSSYTGDGVSGVYVWGAQIEQGTYPTTLIKSNGAVVTRLADEVGNAGSVDTINSEEGVLYFEGAALYDNDIAANRAISLSDGSERNTLYFKYDNQKSVVQVFYRVNNVNVSVLSQGGVNLLEYNQYAITWDSTTFKLYVNGFLFKTNTITSSFAPNTLTNLSLSIGGLASKLEAKTKELRVYKSIAEAKIDLPYIT